MELLKDYDYTIEHHLGRANVVANALNRKVIGSLGYIQTIYYPLLETLTDMRIKLKIDYSRSLLASFHRRLVLIDQVKEVQCHDSQLIKIKSEVK